jgi:hypothetical protein
MENTRGITKYFAEIETTKEHNRYFCSVLEALTIVILGSFCCLRNTNRIHQWAESPRVSKFLEKYFIIGNSMLLLDAMSAKTHRSNAVELLLYEMGAVFFA